MAYIPQVVQRIISAFRPMQRTDIAEYPTYNNQGGSIHAMGYRLLGSYTPLHEPIKGQIQYSQRGFTLRNATPGFGRASTLVIPGYYKGEQPLDQQQQIEKPLPWLDRLRG